MERNNLEQAPFYRLSGTSAGILCGQLISVRGALLSRDTAADNITQLAPLLLPLLARWADPGLLLMLVLRSAAGDKLEAAADQLL